MKPRQAARIRRHVRLRKRVRGTAGQPRLSLHRSLRHLFVQLIDDDRGVSLLGCSTKKLGPEIRANMKGASELGVVVAKEAVAKGIARVVFDRGGFRYHGVVKAFAEAARKGGLQF